MQRGLFCWSFPTPYDVLITIEQKDKYYSTHCRNVMFWKCNGDTKVMTLQGKLKRRCFLNQIETHLKERRKYTRTLYRRKTTDLINRLCTS